MILKFNAQNSSKLSETLFGSAVSGLRFANNPNLDMDDAMTGAATQEFQEVSWTSSADGLIATLEVNFLKFQKLSFLAIYARGDDETDGNIRISKLSLSGRG